MMFVPRYGSTPLCVYAYANSIGVDLLSSWDGQEAIRFRLLRCCLRCCVVVLDHDSADSLVMLSTKPQTIQLTASFRRPRCCFHSD